MAEGQPPPEAKLLPDPPTDGITELKYLPESSLLAATSWDGTVRVYDTAQLSAKLSQTMDSGPLLSLAVSKDTLYTGGLDGSIRMMDINSTEPQAVGTHQHNDSSKVACSCLEALNEPSTILASAGWHSQLHLWDLRQQTPAATIELPGKAFAMDADASHNRLVVGCAGRRTCLIDVRRGDADVSAELVLERESSLKFQTRCIRFFPDGAAIAVGSVEGRVAVEYLEEVGMTAPGKKYAFKCHRVNDLVYPVNCIDFHPHFGTFATGGCDGTVVTWDGLNKKKLTTLPSFPTSIAALAFNNDGSELAIASSYTFEEGEREHPKDEIYVRKMLDPECMPKKKE